MYYVILSRYIVLEIKFNMAWVGCISVANHSWSYEPRMRTVSNNNNNNIYLKSNIHSIIRYKFSGLYNGIKHGIHIKTVQCI